MKNIFLGMILAAAFTAMASAQRLTGYVFGAPGGVTGPGKTRATLQAGAAPNWLYRKALEPAWMPV